MKKILPLPLLWLLLLISQVAVGQDIIMGSAPFVADIDDSPRHFYDPGGVPGTLGANQDPNGYFAQNLRDTMTLHANMSNTVLYAYFEEFAMTEGDSLWIFDGPDCNSPLLGVYNLLNSPGEIYASGQNMTFVFHSDNVDVVGLMTGWDAQIYAYDTLPQNKIFGTDFYNVTCNAVFFDSGGPSGNIESNNENIDGTAFTQFSSPLGSHIKCEFTEFSVNGVLKIYDGLYDGTWEDNNNHRLIGQFCTSTLDASTGNKPPVLFSSTHSLIFVYVGAPGDMNKMGWRAEISCVPELFEVPDYNPFIGMTIVPGGAYSEVYDPHLIELDTSNPVVILEANVIAPGQYANDYSVKQIPFDSYIFPFDEGTSIPAISDDAWLSGVQLPFAFSFFGKLYDTVYPGTNGLISMNSHEGSYSNCAYAYGVPPETPPYNISIQGNQTMGGGSMTVPYNYNNCIYGVYEDVDCRYYNSYSFNTMGAVRTGVLGNYPNRAFVFNFLNVGLFGNHSDPSYYNTYQMVIHEGTNIIDVYVKHRACCATTNNARYEGIIGLQNSTSSQILIAPDRGMTGWGAHNEAWRFTPITPLDEEGQLTWYANSVAPENIICSDPHAKNRRIVVSPVETTQYIAEYSFTNASGEQFTLRDTTLVLCPEIIDSTGVADRNADFVAYPNPTHDVVYVKMRKAGEIPSAIEVLDLNGRSLFTVPAQELTRVDLSRWPAGIYFLKPTGKHEGAVKIVKQ